MKAYWLTLFFIVLFIVIFVGCNISKVSISNVGQASATTGCTDYQDTEATAAACGASAEDALAKASKEAYDDAGKLSGHDPGDIWFDCPVSTGYGENGICCSYESGQKTTFSNVVKNTNSTTCTGEKSGTSSGSGESEYEIMAKQKACKNAKEKMNSDATLTCASGCQPKLYETGETVSSSKSGTGYGKWSATCSISWRMACVSTNACEYTATATVERWQRCSNNKKYNDPPVGCEGTPKYY